MMRGGTWSGTRSLVVLVVCFVAWLVVSPVVAFGEVSSTEGLPPAEGGGGSSSSPLGGALVIAGSPVQAEQVLAAEEAKLSSPEAVAAREESQTKYEGLSAEGAVRVAGEAFPTMIDDSAGGLKLPVGESVTGYPSDFAAQVVRPGGGRGVVESMAPVAVEVSPGQRVPVDLGLGDVGGAFEPRVTAVGVRIAKQSAQGASLTDSGVSLTPVDAQGSSLGGSEGTVAGASIFFANAQTDADVVIKPTSTGFEEDTVLRAIDSPASLSFGVGLPQGASLAQTGGGAVQVIDEGVVIALVPVPSARDAAGVSVPVSMNVSAGNILTLTVEDLSTRYTYPIAVDPTIVDKNVWEQYDGGNWAFVTGTEAFGESSYCTPTCGYRPSIVHSSSEPSYQRGQYAYLEYKTKGESKIYNFRLNTHRESEDTLTAPYIAIAGSSYEAGPKEIPPTLCCETWFEVGATGSNGNTALFETIASGSGSREFQHELMNVEVGISQEKGPSVTLSPPTGWVNWNTELRIGAEASDPGLGVESVKATAPGFPKWGWSESISCNGVQCPASSYGSFSLPQGEVLPEGEDTIEAVAKDPVGLTATTAGKIKIDNLPPHIVLSGLGSGNVIGEREYNLKVEATDGSGSVPSSGVKAITAWMDSRELGKRSGSCLLGPCTVTDEWQINGGEFGVGEHKLRVVATDNAGNEASEEITVKVHHATPVPLGPGAVGPASGQFSLNTTDVSVGAPGSGLTVSRGAYSRSPTTGSGGPLGPQWSLSVGGQESILKVGSSVSLVAASGGRTTFTSNGKGGFTSPKGDANLILSEVKNEKGELTEYALVNAAHAGVTRFTAAPGQTGVWKPTRQEGPLSSQTMTYSYQTVEGVTEPVEALAPEAAGVSCGTKVEELKDGCRALTFKYATETTAKGENESEWGEYKNRLSQIVFHAYNPSSKAMEEKTVAQYSYDAQGRLRAEWDPRISPALKTVYGYDSEGRVTAITPAGQQSWLLSYGTTPGDLSTGRLLKIMRPPASTPLWAGEAPSNTEAPKLTGTPTPGVRMAVSTGTWSHSPVSYGYQWEQCNKEGKGCSLIAGATNANYTPVAGDLGHTLLAEVIAVNGGGSVAATSAVTGRVSAAEEYLLPSGSSSYGIVSGPDGNLWYTELFNSKIGKITTSGTVTEYSGASFPTKIAVGPDKNLWYTSSLANKIGKITTSGTITQYTLPEKSEPWSIAAGPDGNLWFTDRGTSKIGKITTSGTVTEYALPAGSEPMGITTGPDNNLWFAGKYKVGKITTSGAITEYTLTGLVASGIASGPDSNLWVTAPSSNKISKITTSGTTTQYSLPSGSEPEDITAGSDKNLWFTEYASSKLGKITTSGTVSEYTLPAGTGPEGITSGPDEKVWFTGLSANTIGKINPGGPTEGEQHAPSPGSTIEYRVPMSGAGLPTLSKEEVEKWGQTQAPTEGMAIFPPDEPQSWPATDYKHASLVYLDEEDHATNAYSPTGGISTTEYNELNDVVRTLSPDNRAAALKEGCNSKTECKSSEVAKLLDVESAYNLTGSEPGTQLLETLGPQHTVKLAQGKEKAGEEVLARDHVRYYYNEGAPTEGGPYDLVTKTIDGAQTPSKEEFDKRETVTAYSGQENLGWELRKPTAVVTDPNGLTLTHSTFYDPNTGNVTETRMPAGGNGTQAGGYKYSAQYTKETEAETCTLVLMKHPDGAVFDLTGNMWVLDTASDKVDELSPSGRTVIRFGSEGSGNGQFKEPSGIAIDKEGHIWVSDTGNSRMEEFSTKGEFLKTFGVEGKEHGQFKKPAGIAFNSEGDIWVADRGNSRIQELSSSGTYMHEALALGAPEAVTVDTKNNLWATVGSTVAEYAPTGGFPLLSFGETGTENGKFKEPAGLAFSGSNLYVVDRGNSRVQEFQITETEGKASSKYVAKFGTSGSGQGEFKEPQGITFDKEGHVWIADAGNNRIEELTTTGEYLAQASNVSETCMKNPGALALDPSGNVWVADTANDRVVELSSTGKALLRFGAEGSLTSQFKEPRGIATDSSGNVWVADTGNNRVQEFGSKGEYLRTVGSTGKENGQLEKPTGVTISSEGDIWVADSGNERLEEFSSTGTYLAQVMGYKPEGIAADAKGNVWFTTKTNYVWDYSPSTKKTVGWLGGSTEFKHAAGLAVSGEDVYVADRGNNRVKVFKYAEKEGSLSGEYLTSLGTGGTGNGQFEEPAGVAPDKEGHVWVADAGNNRVQEFTQTSTGPHSTQTTYYSAGANLRYPGCGGHPEWANLACQTQPTEQPGTSELPNLPITTYNAYNMLDEPETITETVGSTTRTKTAAYDAAGRVKTSTVSSSVGTSLPTISNEYNSETGALIKQCANEGKSCSEGKPKTITSAYNTLGQLTSYTDSSEATTTYEYEGEGAYKGTKELDGRLRHTNTGKGTETYTYNATTGLLSELLNEYGTTKLLLTAATYDVEGNMLTEGYPNGMNANHTYNPAGAPVGLEYKKTTHCTEKCTWFSDTLVPSIHGQTLEQTSTLSHQAYTYDMAGRLTQVQNTPAGKGCTTRIYAYDEDTNRTGLTTREPNSKGECATEGGTTEKHTYDTADRLIDPGATYNTFGDITKLPPADAGGKEPPEELTSAYYTNNQVASQTQNGQTIGYNLDPAARTIETVATGKKTATTILHYTGPGDAPAWTSNNTGETTRNIPELNGQLVAIQNNNEAPELQLTNLHGDIIAKAYLSETATGLASTADTSEFGVPTTNLPSKYSWLGALELPTELPSGVTTMGVRSYVPEIGRYLQPDPIPGGSANAYTYTYGNPINTSDPTGQSTIQELVAGHAGEVAHEAQIKEEAEIAARRAAEEAAARQAAQQAAEIATLNRGYENYLAGLTGGNEEEWGEEEGEEGEEGEESEEGVFIAAANHHGKTQEQQGANFGPGVETQEVEGASVGTDHVRLCVGHSKRAQTPCARYASIFSKAWHWVKKHIHKLVAVAVLGLTTAVIAGVTLVSTIGCEAGTDGLETLHCYQAGVFGATLAVTSAGATIAAWKKTRN